MIKMGKYVVKIYWGKVFKYGINMLRAFLAVKGDIKF